MKKLAKLFLLAILRVCFLGFSYSQNLENTNYWEDTNYGDYIIGANRCLCSTPLRELFSILFLILIGFFLVILSLGSISLYKKYKDTLKCANIFRIPILNLYPLFKVTIGKIWFYCLILFILFFGYLVYSNRDGCCHFPTELLYPVVVIGILSIVILLILLIKLIIISRKLDKESSNRQNIK